MRKWIFCALVLAAIPVLSFGGFGGEDVGKLHPVQVVEVRADNNEVQLLTDSNDLGVGKDVSQAINNMNETSHSKVFLDTADYLLVKPGAEIWLPRLYQYLRPSCNVCYVTAEVDLKQVGQYLQLHEPKLTLIQYQAGERRLPYLISDEGRMKLVRP